MASTNAQKDLVRERGKAGHRPSFNSILPKVEAVLFDMDGVIRDVSQSYRLAIKKTVGKLSGSDATDEEVAMYKERYNNDWDCTFEILRNERFFADADPKRLMDDVKGTFQLFYLGAKRNGRYDGFISNERVIADPRLMKRLMRGHRTGIVSGAPLEEIVYKLREGDIMHYFETVYSMEDARGAGNPKIRMIKAAKRKLLCRTACYLGDGIGDMEAAVAAGAVPIGIMPAGIDDATWSGKLMDAGAAVVFSDVNNAIDILLQNWENPKLERTSLG